MLFVFHTVVVLLHHPIVLHAATIPLLSCVDLAVLTL